MTGLTEPLPQSDHVQIDMNTGQTRFTGPVTKEEKAEFEKELEQLQIDLETNTDPNVKAVLQQELEQTEKVLGIIRRLMPGV